MLQNQKFFKMIVFGQFVFWFNTVNAIFDEKCDNWHVSGWQTRVYWKTERVTLANEQKIWDMFQVDI